MLITISRLPVASRLAFSRSFGSASLPISERRFRWWERPKDFQQEAARPRTNWWEQKETSIAVEDRARREAVRNQVKDLQDFTVSRPPSQKLVVSQQQGDGTMDEIIQPLLDSAKSAAEEQYLASFLGKPSRVGHEFFDIEKWTRFWGGIAEDYQKQRSTWNATYKTRKDAKRKERIRLHQGVQGDISRVFDKDRAAELWGNDFDKVKRKIKGFVVGKEGERFSVLWAVPGNRFELLKNQSSGVLETIFPQEYVPEFDAFSYSPSFEIGPEMWLEQSLMEHPLLFVTESRSDPAYIEGTKLVQGSAYGTIDLSAKGVSESTRMKVKKHLVGLTNWPTLPQIFVSSIFLGGMENLKELKENGSLNTVLIMAGAKSKHIVDREADKYRDLIAELVSEWRYKKIDKVTKSIESLKSMKAGDKADAQKDELANVQKLLQRLRANDQVADLYFEELRAKFLQDSALEIERLTLHKEASRVRFLLPEDDPRVTLEIVEKALNHRFFKSSLSRWRAKMLMGRRGAAGARMSGEQENADLQTDLEFNVTDGPTSTKLIEGEEPIQKEMTDEQARAIIEDKGESDSEDDRRELLKLLRYINAEMVSKFGPMKRRVFYEHFTKCLSEAYADEPEIEEISNV